MGSSVILFYQQVLFKKFVKVVKRLKFLLLCNSLNIGGIETYILRFAGWLRKNHPKYELHLVCKSGEYGSYTHDFQKIGVALHAIPMGYINPLQYFQFYQFLKRNPFDAICDFGGDFGALPLICASAAKIRQRVVFYRNARNSFIQTSPKRLYQSFLNSIVRILSTRILSNSQDAFNYYYKNYPTGKDPRFQIIRNGIPTGAIISYSEKSAVRRDIGISQKQKMVLHVGSGRWEKNHFTMLKIAEIAQNRNTNICFCFVGSRVAEKYDDVVRTMGLNNVRFLGQRRDVYRLLQAADVFLFPSLTEGQPNAFLEAITQGLPFVASDIAPIRESLPPFWGRRWLFAPDNLEHGCSILQAHLESDFRQDRMFKKLVSWSRSTYKEGKWFNKLLDSLTQVEKI